MNRLYILDPVCALSYGHNINALHYFREFFVQQGLDVHTFASRLLPEALTQGNIEREFTFLYGDVINVEPLLTSGERDLLRSIHGHNDKLALATGEMRAFLDAFRLTSDDAVFFPSVDFYGLMGILRALSAVDPARAPKLYLRFIGVMERTAPGFPEPRARLLDELRRYLRGRPDSVRISAETPRLAAILAEELAVPAIATPYPLTGDALPMETEGPLVILAAGAARLDKGYLRLRQIYQHLTEEVGLGKFEFLIQSAPDELVHQTSDYSRELFRLAHVNILPSVLSHEAMVDCYRRCHVVAMPYAADVYAERGSAVMQEAAAAGRYVVGQRGTGFASQIVSFGIGLVANTELDFANQLGRIVSLPRERLAELALEGRDRYAEEARRSYENWLAA